MPISGDSNLGRPAPKEWRQPELRKLPIEATSNSPSKGGVDNCENVGGPKNADAGSQIS
jgi:hypothetical protein